MTAAPDVAGHKFNAEEKTLQVFNSTDITDIGKVKNNITIAIENREKQLKNEVYRNNSVFVDVFTEVSGIRKSLFELDQLVGGMIYRLDEMNEENLQLSGSYTKHEVDNQLLYSKLYSSTLSENSFYKINVLFSMGEYKESVLLFKERELDDFQDFQELMAFKKVFLENFFANLKSAFENQRMNEVMVLCDCIRTLNYDKQLINVLMEYKRARIFKKLKILIPKGDYSKYMITYASTAVENLIESYEFFKKIFSAPKEEKNAVIIETASDDGIPEELMEVDIVDEGFEYRSEVLLWILEQFEIVFNTLRQQFPSARINMKQKFSNLSQSIVHLETEFKKLSVVIGMELGHHFLDQLIESVMKFLTDYFSQFSLNLLQQDDWASYSQSLKGDLLPLLSERFPDLFTADIRMYVTRLVVYVYQFVDDVLNGLTNFPVPELSTFIKQKFVNLFTTIYDRFESQSPSLSGIQRSGMLMSLRLINSSVFNVTSTLYTIIFHIPHVKKHTIFDSIRKKGNVLHESVYNANVNWFCNELLRLFAFDHVDYKQQSRPVTLDNVRISSTVEKFIMSIAKFISDMRYQASNIKEFFETVLTKFFTEMNELTQNRWINELVGNFGLQRLNIDLLVVDFMLKPLFNTKIEQLLQRIIVVSEFFWCQQNEIAIEVGSQKYSNSELNKCVLANVHRIRNNYHYCDEPIIDIK
ncbi:hypothetical protein PCE1_003694 [Barthelona sp. PCE]